MCTVNSIKVVLSKSKLIDFRSAKNTMVSIESGGGVEVKAVFFYTANKRTNKNTVIHVLSLGFPPFIDGGL